MNKKFDNQKFSDCPIIGILRNIELNDLKIILDISIKSGIKNIEITMNTTQPEEKIKTCIDLFSDKLNIGAGTVINLKSLHRALEAGAQFIVTPNTNKDIIEYCKKNSIPIFAGAFTPTEILNAYQYGAKMIKIFPANMLDPKYLKTIKGPLNNIPLMPTGGIFPETMQQWKDVGADAFGIGENLFNPNLIKNRDWESLSNNIKKYINAMNEII